MCASAARGSRRRWPFRLAILLLALAGVIAATSQLGRVLHVQDEVRHSDAMLVLSGSRADRWLEAVELYREGHAPLILISPGGVDGGEEHLRARGIVLPTDADLARDVMVKLGVPAEAIASLSGKPDNTAQEAMLFHQMAVKAGWRRLTVVTSKLHTRRARFAFRRDFAGTGVEVFVRGSRFDRTDPVHWWRSRESIREVLVESIKLVTYLLGLGA